MVLDFFFLGKFSCDLLHNYFHYLNMQLTITTYNDALFTLEVPEDIELENFKAYCEIESGLPAAEIILVWNGTPLDGDKKSLTSFGISSGDMLFLQPKRMSSAGGSSGGSASASSLQGGMDFGGQQPSQQRGRQAQVDPLALRGLLLASPHEVALLKQNNPPLAEALADPDPQKFVQVFTRQAEEKRRAEAEKMALLTGDPFDPEVQRRIAEAIQQENVNANMEAAMEFSPESFGQVHMLYINCKVNGHAVKAFVDSGAQMTIMSKSCANRCNISHLIDKRWAGVARGVGVQRILGRVHMCQISISQDHLQCSFSILEDQQMDMLLGLDMLKRHQCCIDLKKNVLVIGTTGGETPFLSEAELPEAARLNRSLSAVERDREMAEAVLNSEKQATGSTPSTSQQSEPSPSTSGRQGPVASYPDHLVAKVMNSGFSREQAVRELANTGGDVDKALINLLAKSISLPKK